VARPAGKLRKDIRRNKDDAIHYYGPLY
jgi:hypothetical protein